MVKEQPKRDPIKFTDGEMIEVTFDFDVDSVRGFEQESKYTESGKRMTYPINVSGTQVIFASESLFKKLTNYKREDKASIGLVDGRWIVMGNSSGSKGQESFKKNYEDTAVMATLQQILTVVEEIKAKINNEEGINYPKDEDLGF